MDEREVREIMEGVLHDLTILTGSSVQHSDNSKTQLDFTPKCDQISEFLQKNWPGEHLTMVPNRGGHYNAERD